MEQISAAIHTLIVHFGYFGLFLVAVLGNLGAPVGLEVVMPTAGALAGSGHLPPLGVLPGWVVVGVVGTLGEVIGGLVLYTIGWYGGLPLVQRYGKYVGFREHHLARVHTFYEKHGRSMVFWCRFIPFVRGVAALPPGISRMPKRFFVTYSALGSIIFCFGLAWLGDEAGHNLDAILGVVHDFALAIVITVVVVILGGIAVWRARRRSARARAARVSQH